MCSSSTKQIIFLLILLGLVCQGFIMYDQGEPYPAIWAPGFGSQGVETSYIKPEFRLMFSDGDIESLTAAEILRQFPDSKRGAISTKFLPIRADDSRPDRKLHSYMPGYRKGSYERINRKPEIWAWFKTQAKHLFEREDLIKVEVNWLAYSLPGDKLIGNKGTYSVEPVNVE
jgi:hypothetical protein